MSQSGHQNSLFSSFTQAYRFTEYCTISRHKQESLIRLCQCRDLLFAACGSSYNHNVHVCKYCLPGTKDYQTIIIFIARDKAFFDQILFLFFLLLYENECCGYSFEASCRGVSMCITAGILEK